jgi:hypothetical protein
LGEGEGVAESETAEGVEGEGSWLWVRVEVRVAGGVDFFRLSLFFSALCSVFFIWDFFSTMYDKVIGCSDVHCKAEPKINAM